MGGTGTKFKNYKSQNTEELRKLDKRLNHEKTTNSQNIIKNINTGSPVIHQTWTSSRFNMPADPGLYTCAFTYRGLIEAHGRSQSPGESNQ